MEKRIRRNNQALQQTITLLIIIHQSHIHLNRIRRCHTLQAHIPLQFRRRRVWVVETVIKFLKENVSGCHTNKSARKTISVNLNLPLSVRKNAKTYIIVMIARTKSQHL